MNTPETQGQIRARLRANMTRDERIAAGVLLALHEAIDARRRELRARGRRIKVRDVRQIYTDFTHGLVVGVPGARGVVAGIVAAIEGAIEREAAEAPDPAPESE